MRRPKRLTALILTALLMLSLASAAVAADKDTSFTDLKSYVCEMEYEKN